jgi:hypothetical protein
MSEGIGNKSNDVTDEKKHTFRLSNFDAIQYRTPDTTTSGLAAAFSIFGVGPCRKVSATDQKRMRIRSLITFLIAASRSLVSFIFMHKLELSPTYGTENAIYWYNL